MGEIDRKTDNKKVLRRNGVLENKTREYISSLHGELEFAMGSISGSLWSQ